MRRRRHLTQERRGEKVYRSEKRERERALTKSLPGKKRRKGGKLSFSFAAHKRAEGEKFVVSNDEERKRKEGEWDSTNCLGKQGLLYTIWVWTNLKPQGTKHTI